MSILSTAAIANSLTSGKLTVGGLASGLDTDKIIEGLTALDQQKITRVDTRKTALANEQSAYKQIEARLLGLQTNLAQLARPQNGLFEARNATPSDPTMLTAAASRMAVPAVYQLHVGSLARAHQMASQGFDAVSSSVTHGTLQINVGDQATTVTIDSSNDTLQGLVNAVNNSGAAVTASIVNDGSGDGHQGSRLLLSAKATGVSNRIVVTNNLAASGGGATKPIFHVNSVGSAVSASSNTSTSTIQSNAGATYTGTANNLYHFTVATGGAVGTDDGLQIAYSDATGTHTGTITLNHADANTLVDVAEGIRVQFGDGTLTAGDTFDVKTFVPTVQDAVDATVTLGSGSGALTVKSATNQVDALIPGVTLNLLSSDPAKEISLTVANDTDRMSQGIQDFIGAYNELMAFIDNVTSYNAETKQAGILLGDRQAQTIQEQVRSIVTSVIPGANPRLNNLTSLGISTDNSGYLFVNQETLDKVLTGGSPGVTLDDVRKLFALTGTTSNPGIGFVTASDKTRATTSPYSLVVTQAADKAALTATSALAATTVIGGGNNQFTVSLDGVTSSVLTLAAGSYTRTALAQAVQAAINGDANLIGRRVNVELDGSNLSITSDRFGSASQIVMQGGTALSALGFAVGASAQGHNVAGHFIVDGHTETAHGSGQFLIGDSANTNTADLQYLVTLTSGQVGAGTTADITVSRGVASRLDSLLTNFFDPGQGRLKVLEDGFDAAAKDLDAQKTRLTDLMNGRRQALLAQFNAMEQTLSKLQAASAALTNQANNLSKQS
jgi:flagellar hook-associated protein 2